ncbi:hypothetical protein AVEN_155869-1 [Araneus ventricosus]|uniref:Uncharacterized protein n=1 Tax=Araneus ventricosus TaxID=182803 RepID=A0A4Y2AMZ8_ARAVE|nr:hypothetical protein AVEN_155869-1 [Araneus ventricosus]
MLSDGVTLPHNNNHTAYKTQELMRKFKREVWNHSPPPIHPRFGPNLGSKHLSGTRFSSESDVKPAAQSCLNVQGRNSTKPS